MKKIVGIIGAALLASSIFAVDFSAGVRLQGSLFDFDSSTKEFDFLKEEHVNEFYHLPFSFSVSGDKAGGQLKFSDKGSVLTGSELKDGKLEVTKEDNKYLVTDAWSIWFKPVDILKITVGRWSTNLNQEHIGWCNTDSGIESDGYALSLNTAGFGWDLFFAPGNGKYWLTAPKDGDVSVAELYTKVQYGADFGTINAFFNAKNTFKDFRFGVGYNAGSLLPVGLWVNVIGIYAGEKFERIRAEADVSTNFGSIGWELFIAGGYHMETALNGNNFTGVEGWHVGGSYYLPKKRAFVGAYTKFSIPVDAFGFYVEIKDADFLKDDFELNVKPGFNVNVGAATVGVALDTTIKAPKNGDASVKIGMPLEFKISF